MEYMKQKLIPGSKGYAEREHDLRVKDKTRVFCKDVTKECKPDCPYYSAPLIVNEGTEESPYWASRDCYCTQNKIVVTM